jgi:peptidoglycan/LPS O-acetylase OafA/YrhL
VFAVLLESIVITFLIGVVPPLRVMWTLSLVLVGLLTVYVWLLLAMKHRDAAAPTNAQARASRAPASPRPHRSAAPRYVAEGRSTWARPTFNGLGALGESDRVHVVVRAANPA